MKKKNLKLFQPFWLTKSAWHWLFEATPLVIFRPRMPSPARPCVLHPTANHPNVFVHETFRKDDLVFQAFTLTLYRKDYVNQRTLSLSTRIIRHCQMWFKKRRLTEIGNRKKVGNDRTTSSTLLTLHFRFVFFFKDSKKFEKILFFHRVLTQRNAWFSFSRNVCQIDFAKKSTNGFFFFNDKKDNKTKKKYFFSFWLASPIPLSTLGGNTHTPES